MRAWSFDVFHEPMRAHALLNAPNPLRDTCTLILVYCLILSMLYSLSLPNVFWRVSYRIIRIPPYHTYYFLAKPRI
jgi:hypothetical protein